VDLDEMIRRLQRRLGGLFGGGRGGGEWGVGRGGGFGFGLGLILAVALALWLLSGFYVVQQGERGVVLRFGKKTDVTDAGLHWHWPYPLESVEKVNVDRIYPIEIGYRSNPRTGSKTRVPKEALMLTGDENIIEIEFAVQYKIKDPADYLFNVRDVETTISQATESAVREIVGKSTLDFALTEGRDEIAKQAQDLLQKILDRYRSGIHIVRVETQRAQPPEEVKSAFDDAVKAREDKDRFVKEAEAYANDIIPRARGAAARLVEQAEAYKVSAIARAEGEARRFTQVAEVYAKAPRVTRERLYIETVEQVLSNSTTIFVDQKGGQNLIYLPLDKLLSGTVAGSGSTTGAAPGTPGASSTETETATTSGVRGGGGAGAAASTEALRRRNESRTREGRP
jgi:membrane protease subunit HflK